MIVPLSPLAVNLKITNECNLKCCHCIADSGQNSNRELTLNEWYKIIDDLKENQVFLIDITGGEPLIHPNFFDILSYINSKQFKITLSTNGTLINKKTAKILKEMNVSLAKVSLDGPDSLSHDKIRGVDGAFDNTINGILFLRENDIPVTIQSAISKLNYIYIDEMVNKCSKIGINGINFFTVVPGGRAEGLVKEIFSPEDFHAFLNKVIHLQKKHKKIRILSESPLHQILKNRQKKRSDTYVCLAGKVMLFVKENGDAVPCPYFFEPVGNLLNNKLVEIWSNSVLLSEIRQFNLLDVECQKCHFSTQCFGGCRAAAYYVTGSIRNKDPFCWLQKENN